MSYSTTRPVRIGRRADAFAVLLSGVCLVHCLAVSLAALVLPVSTMVTADGPHFHALMLIIVVPLSVIAIGTGFRRHAQASIIWIAAGGLALMLTGATLAHAWWPALADTALTTSGAVTLAIAHFANARACARVSAGADR